MAKYLHSQKQKSILSFYHKHSKEQEGVPIALQWWWINLWPQYLLCVSCWTPRESPHGHCEQVSKCCVTAWVETIVPVMLVNVMVGKGKQPWEGINSPDRTPALLQQMKSTRDEVLCSSCTHPAPALPPRHRGAWIHLCPHCAQRGPLGQVGQPAVLPSRLCQWICTQGKIHSLPSPVPKGVLQYSSSWLWYSVHKTRSILANVASVATPQKSACGWCCWEKPHGCANLDSGREIFTSVSPETLRLCLTSWVRNS